MCLKYCYYYYYYYSKNLLEAVAEALKQLRKAFYLAAFKFILFQYSMSYHDKVKVPSFKVV